MVQEAQHDRRTAETIATIHKMGEAINRHDLDELMALMTEDVVWETTTPPDGERYEGHADVRAALGAFLRSSPEATFEVEELVAMGDRAILRSIYRWVDRGGKPGHVRGANLLRVRAGKVAESLAYVKG